MHYKSKKNKKCDANILGNNAALDIEKTKFCTNFLLLKTVLNIVGVRNRIKNKSRHLNFSKVGTGTGTAMNHYII